MSFLKKEVTLPTRIALPKLGTPRSPQLPRMRSHRAGAATGRSAGVTGLEIGATQLIAAEGRFDEGRVLAQRAVVRPLEPGLVRDGLVVDDDGLTAELKSMFAGTGLGRRVRVGLATPRTILRVIDLPPLDDKDVKAALTMQAQERIPMPLDRAVLDHQIVGLVDTPEGRRLRAVVVATEREPVERLLEVLKGAGLRPEGIDLSIFAVMRAVGDAAAPTGPTLYAQLGDLVNLGIAESGICQFTRQSPQGLAYVLELLTEQRDVSLPEAQALLMSAATQDTDADRGDVAEVGALLGRVAGELGSELRAAAEFYGIQSGATVSRGIVTGALAPLRGFVPALAEASGLELTCGETGVADGAILGGLDLSVAPVAVGLSVGSVAR